MYLAFSLFAFLFALWQGNYSGTSYFSSESSVTPHNGTAVHLDYFEFYPTVGNLTEKIFLCKADNLTQYMTSCNGLKVRGHKIYWFVDNTNHNSSLYDRATIMNMINHMDGILVIDDDKDQLFDIFGRENTNLILRINTTEAQKLLEYDLFEHFEKFYEKYNHKPVIITSPQQLKEFLQELYTLSQDEVKRFDLQLNYQGVGSCK